MRNKIDKFIEIKINYSFIAKGSKLTVELSDFLKDTGRDPKSNIASYYAVKANLLQRYYNKKISVFKDWEKLNHVEDYLIYPENNGKNLSIDELSLSKEELYTFVTNKKARGKENTLVAVIKGRKSQDIIDVLNKILLEKRKLVQEIILDMTNNIQ